MLKARISVRSAGRSRLSSRSRSRRASSTEGWRAQRLGGGADLLYQGEGFLAGQTPDGRAEQIAQQVDVGAQRRCTGHRAVVGSHDGIRGSGDGDASSRDGGMPVRTSAFAVHEAYPDRRCAQSR